MGIVDGDVILCTTNQYGSKEERQEKIPMNPLRFFLPLSLSLFLSFSAAATAATAPRPNIIVLLCDDLGYGDLSCFAHPEIRTPHLDQLAREGAQSCNPAARAHAPQKGD